MANSHTELHWIAQAIAIFVIMLYLNLFYIGLLNNSVSDITLDPWWSIRSSTLFKGIYNSRGQMLRFSA